MNNLRRRGQSACNHQDADESRKEHVEQAVRELEEQWRTLLQAARQLEAAAAAQISEVAERRQLQVERGQDTDTGTEVRSQFVYEALLKTMEATLRIIGAKNHTHYSEKLFFVDILVLFFSYVL